MLLSRQESVAFFRQAAGQKAALRLHAPTRRDICARSQANASSTASSVVKPVGNPVLMGAVELLFKFPPFFSSAVRKARTMIVDRAEKIGIDWEGTMKELQAQDWEGAVKAITNPDVQFPSYYTQPFHAYPQGNLCLEAALEVTMAAKSVHAMVMDPEGKVMDPEGDSSLRRSYGLRMLECMAEIGVDPTGMRQVVDLGCATGLSSLALMEVLPGAKLTGIDLSPHFLAVGKWDQDRRQAERAPGSPPEPLTLIHGAAESTGLPDASQDLVSACLVFHELPQPAARAIIAEAFRVLRPGGCLSIMEMNPQTQAFQRVLGNPFAYTAFKSTEPWLQDYITLDLHGAIREAGFERSMQREATPRHRAVLAVKP